MVNCRTRGRTAQAGALGGGRLRVLEKQQGAGLAVAIRGLRLVADDSNRLNEIPDKDIRMDHLNRPQGNPAVFPMHNADQVLYVSRTIHQAA